jgi:hypothetical protein
VLSNIDFSIIPVAAVLLQLLLSASICFYLECKVPVLVTLFHKRLVASCVCL